MWQTRKLPFAKFFFNIGTSVAVSGCLCVGMLRGAPMAANVFCFVIGAVAPLVGVSWLLLRSV
jgi:hypothetical protein